MSNQSGASIMLGNGFNLALKNIVPIEINLDYHSISKVVIEKLKAEGNNRLIQMVERCEDDLEYLLHVLDLSEKTIDIINEIYAKNTEHRKKLLEDKKLLRKMVIETILSKEFHPDYNDIFNETYKVNVDTCAKNLKEFQRIYTINYDLILYWILATNHLLKKETDSDKTGKFSDGFSIDANNDSHIEQSSTHKNNLRTIHSTNNKQTLIYLHGALHLLEFDNRGYKIVRDKNRSQLDLKAIRGKILKSSNKYHPLIVFEASSNDKLNILYNNNYLLNSFDKINTTSGDFIVYGCKTMDKDGHFFDEHLWRSIVNSKISNLYIPCHEEGSDNLIKKANSFK